MTLGLFEVAEEQRACERAQQLFLSELHRCTEGRLILRGGAAMRALYGSARMTDNLDFDAEESVTGTYLRRHVPKCLKKTGENLGLSKVRVRTLSMGQLHYGWRLEGALPSRKQTGLYVSVSRIGMPHLAAISTHHLNHAESSVPFEVRAYSLDAMASNKVKVIMGARCHCPRAVFDVHHLHQAKADPSTQWPTSVPWELLTYWRQTLTTKIYSIEFSHVFTDLLPRLAPEWHEKITEKSWADLREEAKGAIEGWIKRAIARRELELRSRKA